MPFSKSAGVTILALTILIYVSSPCDAQVGRIDRITVYSQAVEGNLLGDSPDRDVSVYLPPYYDNNESARYPVIYLLHGYLGTNTFLDKQLKTINTFFDDREIQSLIIVTPDVYNKYRGSFYTNSYLTGNWEDFITQELVNYIDTNYRTIQSAESRGIAGYSMGGYGAIKLAMKHPDIYGATFGLSAAVTDMEEYILGLKKSNLVEAKNATQFENLYWEVQALIALAAAFTPDSTCLPFGADFPITETGEVIDSLWQKWLAHNPFTMIENYKDNLLQLEGIKFVCGMQDDLLTSNQNFSQKLDDFLIAHSYEEFTGGHGDQNAILIKDSMLPFFSDTLEEIDSNHVTAYAKPLESHPMFIPDAGDNLFITTNLYNPEDHPVTVRAIITGESEQNTFKDSVELFDDGQHHDGLASDNTWGNRTWLADLPEDTYQIGISCHDQEENYVSHSIPLTFFTTIGPVTVAEIPYLAGDFSARYRTQYLQIRLKNNGKILPATNLHLEFRTEDIRVSAVAQSAYLDDIAAGAEGLSRLTSFNFAQGYNSDSTINHPIHFEVTVYSDGYPFWTTSFEFKDTTMGLTGKNILLTTDLVLHQNHPNPFNPSTTIDFSLPKSEFVELKIYNILGKEVATLVSNKLIPGNHTYQFDGKNLASGVYYYQLVAGDYREVRKMILLR